jgi:hypothetical protein
VIGLRKAAQSPTQSVDSISSCSVASWRQVGNLSQFFIRKNNADELAGRTRGIESAPHGVHTGEAKHAWVAEVESAHRIVAPSCGLVAEGHRPVLYGEERPTKRPSEC